MNHNNSVAWVITCHITVLVVNARLLTLGFSILLEPFQTTRTHDDVVTKGCLWLIQERRVDAGSISPGCLFFGGNRRLEF